MKFRHVTIQDGEDIDDRMIESSTEKPAAESQPILSGTDATPLPAKEETLPLQEKYGSLRNWPEDFPHENGQYLNRCIRCEQDFIGHKRRVICKRCALHDADCPSRDGFYPENCECSHAAWRKTKSGSASEITEALNRFWSAAVREGELSHPPAPALKSARDNVDAARSRLEQLYREQQQEIDRLRHPLRALSTKGTEE